MNLSIFDFKSYRDYLKKFLRTQPKNGHGIRTLWAEAMGCQIAFVSHVLNGHYEISIEQAEGLARYIALNKDETEYFILLVQKDRAGTHQLKIFFEKLISEKIEQRENIRNRMKIKNNLSIEDQAIYYSKWLYSAVHIVLTIPEFQSSPEFIAKYFNQNLFSIRQILDFLETRQLIKNNNGIYNVENNFLFINKDSPLFSHQQSFWRQKAIESIYKNNKEDIHFASLFTVSVSDIKKIKDILLKSIEETTDIIKPSKEEKLYSICMDMFEVR